jgi:hypothetical protein
LFEFWRITTGYFDTLFNPTEILFNMIHGFGKIYDDVEYLIKAFTTIEYDNLDYWKNLGLYLGDLLNEVFETIDDY